jgi:plasmid stabilization system protein ParE
MATRTKRAARQPDVPPKAKYPLTEEASARLKRAFTYHAPQDDQADRYARLRSLYLELAVSIAEMTPPGREQDAAFLSLETSGMWANAAIARGES